MTGKAKENVEVRSSRKKKESGVPLFFDIAEAAVYAQE